MTPGRRREMVAHFQASHGLSERRSCLALGVDRSSVRDQSRRPDQAPLLLRIRDLAATRTRYGYFRIYILLRREGWFRLRRLRGRTHRRPVGVKHVRSRRWKRREQDDVTLLVQLASAALRRVDVAFKLAPPLQRVDLDFDGDNVASGFHYDIDAVATIDARTVLGAHHIA